MRPKSLAAILVVTFATACGALSSFADFDVKSSSVTTDYRARARPPRHNPACKLVCAAVDNVAETFKLFPHVLPERPRGAS